MKNVVNVSASVTHVVTSLHLGGLLVDASGIGLNIISHHSTLGMLRADRTAPLPEAAVRIYTPRSNFNPLVVEARTISRTRDRYTCRIIR